MLNNIPFEWLNNTQKFIILANAIPILPNHIITYIIDNSSLILPVKILNMPATFKLNCDIDFENIYEYMPLSEDNIITIKYNNKIKSLNNNVVLKKKIKNNILNNNKLILDIRLDIQSKNIINIQLFKKGYVIMSGCKSIKDHDIILNKLIKQLSRLLAIIKDDYVVEKPFISNNIIASDFKTTINSSFNINYLINKKNLYEILLSKRIKCRYDPFTSLLELEFTTSEFINPISIDVFQSGYIYIKGAKKIKQIYEFYKYIKELFDKNYDKIAEIGKTTYEDPIFDNNKYLKDINVLKLLKLS